MKNGSANQECEIMQWPSPLRILDSTSRIQSGFRLGFAQAHHAIAFLPLAAFLEQFDALKAFKNISFRTRRAGRAQTSML
jgi:hypothetical protein